MVCVCVGGDWTVIGYTRLISSQFWNISNAYGPYGTALSSVFPLIWILSAQIYLKPQLILLKYIVFGAKLVELETTLKLFSKKETTETTLNWFQILQPVPSALFYKIHFINKLDVFAYNRDEASTFLPGASVGRLQWKRVNIWLRLLWLPRTNIGS